MPGPTLFRPSNIPSGLQGYWKLDEASGTRADSSGNGYDLTDNNTVTANSFDYWKTGENSALFNSANSEYLSRTDTNALDFAGTSFTLCCWMRRGTDVNTPAFFSKNAASTDGYIFYTPAADTRLGLYLNATLYTSGTGVVGASGDRQWRHVAVVRDVSAGTVMFYVDGNLVYTTTSAVTLSGNAIDFQIGKYGNSAAYFGGDMKDAACWNVALTPIQIKSLALGVDLSLYAYRPNNVSVQPTAWWKMNELSGTRADSIGALTLTDNNTVTALGGYIEGVGAKTLIANSESLSVVDNTAFDFSGGIWSVSLWFKTASLAAAQSIWANGTDNANWISLALSTAGTLTLNVQEANVDVVTVVSVAGVIKVDTNHHIACKENGDTWQIYVDGIDVTSTGGTDASRTANYTGQFYIGADVLNANYSTATYSDFAIWKGYALTDAEIKSLACGIPLQQTGIVSYWKLDETSGNRADSIGANTLTDNNTVLSGTGKVSNAADFENTNSEYLSVTDTSTLDMTTDFSFLGWFKPESIGELRPWFNKDDGSSGYNFAQSGADKVILIMDGVTRATSTTSLVAGTWYHAVVKWDGATAYVYINSVNEHSSAIATAMADNAFDFGFGKRVSGGTTYFDGLADEALIAKRWFRDEEIKTIYCKGLAGKELTSEERASSSGNFFLFF